MDTVDVLVIGGGQAGLATAYWLGRLAPSLQTVVWESYDRIGASWERRWDSLRLFTPRSFCSLPGLAFPDGPEACPTRLEMAAYLRSYADVHALPVRLGRPVTSLRRDGTTGYVVNERLGAREVVIASGPFQQPWLPAAAAVLQVPQRHSSDYHRPADLPAAPVTVVGGGDSAAQLALELSQDRQVTLVAGGQPWFLPARVGGLSTYSWLEGLGILRARRGGAVAGIVQRRREPVFGTDLRDAIREGRITLLPRRVVGAGPHALHLDDGTELPVRAVLWCTGSRPSLDWLEVAGALDSNGLPLHVGGASPVAGLHWMGLPWQRRLDSSIVHGAGPDARATATRIVTSQTRPPGPSRTNTPS